MALKRRSRTAAADIAAQRGHLAAIVSARRQELGLSQVELGDLAGVSYRIVHNVESGRTETSLERLLAILDTLGLHLGVERGGAVGVVASPSLARHYGLVATPEGAASTGVDQDEGAS